MASAYLTNTELRSFWMIPTIDSQLKRFARRLSFAELVYEIS